MKVIVNPINTVLRAWAASYFRKKRLKTVQQKPDPATTIDPVFGVLWVTTTALCLTVCPILGGALVVTRVAMNQICRFTSARYALAKKQQIAARYNNISVVALTSPHDAVFPVALISSRPKSLQSAKSSSRKIAPHST